MKLRSIAITLIASFCALLNANEPTLVMETSQGTIEIELMTKVAPKACENIIEHSKNGYYDGQIFHRVIKNFMIQGGDPKGTGIGGESIWKTNFKDEFDPKVRFDGAGYLAMANRGPNTNGSQFFLTTAKTPWLNGKHTIFGKITKGMDTLKKIEASKVDARDKPLQDQKILKMYVKE